MNASVLQEAGAPDSSRAARAFETMPRDSYIIPSGTIGNGFRESRASSHKRACNMLFGTAREAIIMFVCVSFITAAPCRHLQNIFSTLDDIYIRGTPGRCSSLLNTTGECLQTVKKPCFITVIGLGGPKTSRGGFRHVAEPIIGRFGRATRRNRGSIKSEMQYPASPGPDSNAWRHMGRKRMQTSSCATLRATC